MEPRDALEDVVVLDMTKVLAGPYCGAILADMGATVIKIEIPGKGDDSRNYGPFQNGESIYYGNLNRNKRGMTLNLKTQKGKEILNKLVKKADILLENNRPGTMERLGVGYETLKEINPRLIYGSITGFGCTGRYSDRPGYDIIAQAMGGLMSVTGQEGDPPTRCGNAIGDILGGMNLTIGVLTALHARTLTGKGQYIDISLVDSVIVSLEQAWQRYFATGELPVRHGNSYDAIAPYDSFTAKDGYIVIGCGNQKMFEILCEKILNRPDLIEDPKYKTVPLRVKNNKEFKKIVEEWSAYIPVEQGVSLLLAQGIPAGPIYNLQQISDDPHFCIDRQMFVEVDHPKAGKVRLNGNPVKLSETGPKIRMSFPVLGEHTDDILRKLGYADNTIEEFHLRGVV